MALEDAAGHFELNSLTVFRPHSEARVLRFANPRAASAGVGFVVERVAIAFGAAAQRVTVCSFGRATSTGPHSEGRTAKAATGDRHGALLVGHSRPLIER